jgi:hypothetical protein
MQSNHFLTKVLASLSLGLFILAPFSESYSQSKTEISWQKSIGGSGDDACNSVIGTKDGGWIMAGYTNSPDGDLAEIRGQADADGWVVKFNSLGVMEWQVDLGFIVFDDAMNSIIQTSDGGYIVAGYHGISDDKDSKGGIDVWVIKLNASGEIEWQKYYGGSGVEIASSIIQTSDGGYAFCGYTYSNDKDVSGYHAGAGPFVHDVWVVKINSVGTLEWQKCFGGSSDDEANAIIQTSDGGYAVAAYTASNDGDVIGFQGGYDAWILKLNASGELEWQKCLGGSLQEVANSITEASDGYVISGFAQSQNGNVLGNHASSVPDAWLFKLNKSGNLEWQKCIGGSRADAATSMIKTIEGGYAFVGYTNSSNGDITGVHGDANDMLIVKLNSEGHISWQKCLGGSNEDKATCIAQLKNGDFIIGGSTISSDGNVSGFHGGIYPDAWLVKLGNSESVNSTSENSIPSLKVFPNPTSGLIHISLLSKSPETVLVLKNILGQKLKEFSIKSITGASLNEQLDLGNQRDGTYFIQLQNESLIEESEIKIVK